MCENLVVESGLKRILGRVVSELIDQAEVTCYHIRVPETLTGASVIRQSVGHGAEHYNSANKAGT